ncbi:unnamed protein product [Prorocentrum cordatum]|uniref:Uncharacterized protein n=1 Tax=Prorocentrum cordatum TaxID=2364126 RepID=A0ABN9PEB6_9DINO|nr:unnamed protein product [Polarella glacialis]
MAEAALGSLYWQDHAFVQELAMVSETLLKQARAAVGEALAADPAAPVQGTISRTLEVQDRSDAEGGVGGVPALPIAAMLCDCDLEMDVEGLGPGALRMGGLGHCEGAAAAGPRPRAAAPTGTNREEGYRAIFAQSISTRGPGSEGGLDDLKDGGVIFPETHVGSSGSIEILQLMGMRVCKVVAASRSHFAATSPRRMAAEQSHVSWLRQLDSDWKVGPVDFWAGWFVNSIAEARAPAGILRACARGRARVLDSAVLSKSFPILRGASAWVKWAQEIAAEFEYIYEETQRQQRWGRARGTGAARGGGGPDELLGLSGGERGAPREMELGAAAKEGGEAWRSPPRRAQNAAACHFDDVAPRGPSSWRGSWARAVEQIELEGGRRDRWRGERLNSSPAASTLGAGVGADWGEPSRWRGSATPAAAACGAAKRKWTPALGEINAVGSAQRRQLGAEVAGVPVRRRALRACSSAARARQAAGSSVPGLARAPRTDVDLNTLHGWHIEDHSGPNIFLVDTEGWTRSAEIFRSHEQLPERKGLARGHNPCVVLLVMSAGGHRQEEHGQGLPESPVQLPPGDRDPRVDRDAGQQRREGLLAAPGAASRVARGRNATAVHNPGFPDGKIAPGLAAEGAVVMRLEARAMMEVTVGGYPSASDACDACFTSFTKQGVPPAGPVAPHCVCMSYPDGGEHTMFCATPVSAADFVAEKGGCRCKPRDMEAMGDTTCEPIS